MGENVRADAGRIDPTETWQTGTEPPGVPQASAAATVVENDGNEPFDTETVGIARIRFDPATPMADRETLDELDREPTIRTVLAREADSSTYDLLVDSNHDVRTVATALAYTDDVTGVATATYPVDPLVEQVGGPAATVSTADECESTATDEVFESLKAEHDQVTYDALVAELRSGPFASEPIPEVDGDSPAEASTDDEREPGDETTEAEGLDPDAVVEAFVSALEAGDLTDDQRETIRTAMGWGAFIDECGRAEALLTDVADVETEVTTLADDLEAARMQIDHHEDRFDELEAVVARTNSRLDDQLERIDDDVDALQAWQRRLMDALTVDECED